MTDSLSQLTCLRCGHTWWPRTPGRPGVCPQCKNREWDKPKEGPTTKAPTIAHLSRPSVRVPLRLDTENTASSYGIGVLVFGAKVPEERWRKGDILDGMRFRFLRAAYNYEIICEPGQCSRVYRALGVPEGEPGVVEQEKEVTQ